MVEICSADDLSLAVVKLAQHVATFKGYSGTVSLLPRQSFPFCTFRYAFLWMIFTLY